MAQRSVWKTFLAALGACALAASAIWPSSSQAVLLDEAAPETREDKDFATAERLVKERHFTEAMPLLKAVIARDPGNADAYNYLAFSQRKLGHLGEALGNYMRALDLDPDHIGAREYLGELYVQLGEMDKADEQLTRLKLLCPLGCEARDDLARAIAESSLQQLRK